MRTAPDGPRRIAFLTTEFVSEDDSYGGLASYLNRMTKALIAQGHEAEVFIAHKPRSKSYDFHGVRVECVSPRHPRWLRTMDTMTGGRYGQPWGGAYGSVSGALGLASALERRHRERPFHIVQSANWGATGLFVPKRKGRRHLLRLSSDRALWVGTDGAGMDQGIRAIGRLEHLCRRRADMVYAPSRFLAEHCARTGGRRIEVCHPPVYLEAAVADSSAGTAVPERFLLHFGQISPRKGSDTIAEALRMVVREVPDFRMLWAGLETWPGEVERCRAICGPGFDGCVTYLGKVRKGGVYALVRRALATVLPSKVDNLPNTVIESLVLGTPVIGSKGASIDELVEHGKSGELVPIGDAKALAEAMVRAWNGRAAWQVHGFQRPAVLDELSPERAVANLLRLAGHPEYRAEA